MAQMSQMGELALVSGMAELLKEMPHKPGEGKEIQVSEREVLQFLVSFLSFLSKSSSKGVMNHCWIVMQPFIKESTLSSKPYVKEVLKLMDFLFSAVSPDQRTPQHWKDCEEVYCKVFEATCQQAAKLLDAGGKGARSIKSCKCLLPQTL